MKGTRKYTCMTVQRCICTDMEWVQMGTGIYGLLTKKTLAFMCLEMMLTWF